LAVSKQGCFRRGEQRAAVERRSKGSADGGRQLHRARADADRRRCRGQQFAGELEHGTDLRNLTKHDRELTAAHAGNDAAITDRGEQSQRDLAEDGVAGVMAEGVVDELEPGDVKDADCCRGSSVRGERGIKRRHQRSPGGKTGERVAPGEFLEHGLGRFALRDVGDVDHHRADRWVVQRVRQRLLHPPPRPVRVPHPRLKDVRGPGWRGGGRAPDRPYARLILRMDERIAVSAHQIVRVVAEPRLDRAADEQKSGVGVAEQRDVS
jgi:hypothetical protein